MKIAAVVALCVIGVAIAVEKNYVVTSNNDSISVTLHTSTCSDLKSCEELQQISINPSNKKIPIDANQLITQIDIEANGKTCSIKYSPQATPGASINTDLGADIVIDKNIATVGDSSCELK